MHRALEKAVAIIQAHGGIMQTSKAIEAGIHQTVFYRLKKEGIIIRLERGLYSLADYREISNPDLVVIAGKVPKGVVCLVSALVFHEITTRIPRHVDIAISRGIRPVSIRQPPVKYYFFSKATYENGIEKKILDGIPIKVYCVEKTLADCFKFRNRIGLDTALEALNLYRERMRFNVSEILRYAKVCRVSTVIKPYLEALQ